MSESKDINEDELIEFSWRGRAARRIYPEVHAYLSQYRQAEFEYTEAVQAARDASHAAERRAYHEAEMEGRSFDYYANTQDEAKRSAWRQAQREAEAAALTERDALLNPLKEALLNSSHSDVKFIAEKCLFAREGGEVENYARDILAILPATTEQIWAEAKQNRGMCDVFDRFYDQAEEAGVFNGGHKSPAAREISALRNYIRRNYGGSYVSSFMDRLNPILKAYQEDYDAKLVAAKAEWQGLDEAWRSERSRRAAATRAERRGTASDAERTAEQEAQRLERSVITTQSAMTGETIRAEYDESGPVNKEAAPALRIVANPA